MKSVVAVDEENLPKSLNCDEIPEVCPICHKKTSPKLIQSFLDTRRHDKSLQIVFRCGNEFCRNIFIAYYRGRYVFPTNFHFMFSRPRQFLEKEFSQIIKDISKNFVIAYNQSFIAEQSELTEICGTGYRKSLEFLIKDYLIFKNPKIAKKIKAEFLGTVIIKRVKNIKLKEVAKRAAWLGNDETHYERIWIDKDIVDLKKAIDLVVSWIDTDCSTEDFLKSMPEKITEKQKIS